MEGVEAWSQSRARSSPRIRWKEGHEQEPLGADAGLQGFDHGARAAGDGAQALEGGVDEESVSLLDAQGFEVVLQFGFVAGGHVFIARDRLMLK